MVTVREALEVTIAVAHTLERLGVPYLVGGSLASSLHGLPRATQDADIVADLRTEHVLPLVTALQDGFYVHEPAVREAVETRASFNVIHLKTMFKVDVFVARRDLVTTQEMERRQRYLLTEQRAEISVASPEDILVQKLYWYRLGDHISERQWTDALGVLKVRGRSMDREYMRQVAFTLGVADLLERILRESGLDG